MKRTLSLLLSLILLCGICVPAVQAAGPRTYQVDIRCPNWYTEMDPDRMTYEIKTSGFTLDQQPHFFYITAGGGFEEETGMRRSDAEYTLVIPLNTDLPFDSGDEIVVTLNGHRSQFQTTDGNHVAQSLRGCTAALYMDVGSYLESDMMIFVPDYLCPGRKLSDLEFLFDYYNVDCDSSVTVYMGDTVNAPVMQPEDTFNIGSDYLFEVCARPRLLNQRLLASKMAVSTDFVEFLRDRTVFNSPADPDAVKFYFRYAPRDLYPIETFVSDGTYVMVKDAETGNEVNEAEAGTQLNVSANLPPEKEFDHWEIEGLTLPEHLAGNSEIIITMPANGIKITPVTSSAFDPFTDVGPDDWFYHSVMWAYRHEIANGITETRFGPKYQCTRAQAALMLVNWTNKQPDTEGMENPFTDVKPGAWYYDCIVYGYHENMFKGKTETTFAPNAIITRGQFITMLWKHFGGWAADGGNPFTDVSPDAFYYDAVCWAAKHGVVTGVDAEHFCPNNPLTRAEAVAIMCRADEIFYI